MKTCWFAITLLILGTADFVRAAGYEKNIMWGGRSGGEAGIASTYVSGSDALYFNPAGLAEDRQGNSASLNVSPTWAKFSGPINYGNDEGTSSTALLTPGALMFSRTFSPNFGAGFGYYSSGGAKATYDDVSFPSTGSGTAKWNTDLKINELALGAAYKLNENWKFGAALRYVMASADFAFVAPATGTTTTFLNLEVNGVKMNALGFKLGTQFKASEKTRYSLVWRSEVNVKGDGEYGGKVQLGATASPLDPGKTATLQTTFPMAVIVGAQHDYERWRALAEFVWTQYSRIGEIPIDGVATRAGGTTVLATGTRVALNWYDEYALRLGGEYLGMQCPIRFGYVYTSAVSNKSTARANLTPPGAAHTLTLGTGHTYKVMENPLDFNIGAEYTMSSGDSQGQPAGTAVAADGNYTRSGTFKVTAYALHLGVGYSF